MAGKFGRWVYGTKRWRRLRRVMLIRAGFKCRVCGRRTGLEVDHVLSMALGGKAFDEANLQVLCRTHHIEKTARENSERPKRPKRYRNPERAALIKEFRACQ